MDLIGSDTFEYPERIIYFEKNNILVSNVTKNVSTVPKVYPISVAFLLRLDNMLIGVQPPDEKFICQIVLLDEKLNTKLIMKKNTRNWLLSNIHIFSTTDDKLLMITHSYEISWFFLMNIDSSEETKFFGTIAGFILEIFKIAPNKFISFNLVHSRIACYLINTDDKSIKKIYDKLAEQLKNATSIKKINYSDEDFTLCVVYDLIHFKIINSKNEILLDFWPKNRPLLTMGYDEYENEIILMSNYPEYISSNKIYKRNNKWIVEDDNKCNWPFVSKYVDKIIVTRSKIVGICQKAVLVFNKKTMEYLYYYDSDAPKRHMYYEYYDRWFDKELKYLLELSVLKSMNKNLLTIILSYVS